jgi:hypothetical protein
MNLFRSPSYFWLYYNRFNRWFWCKLLKRHIWHIMFSGLCCIPPSLICHRNCGAFKALDDFNWDKYPQCDWCNYPLGGDPCHTS